MDRFQDNPVTGIPRIDKDAGDALDYRIAYADFLRGGDVDWSPRATYALGQTLWPRIANSNQKRYRCTTPGQAGTTRPTWPSSSTVTDGSVVWTTIGAVPTVSSAVASGDTGITVGTATVDATGNVVTVRVSGGTAGQTYRVTVTATLSTSETVERSFDVMVRDR